MAPGTYDETANGSGGIVINIDNLSIRGIGEGVSITNSNTENNGFVFSVAADDVVLTNLGIEKGEEESTGTVLVNFDACGCSDVYDCKWFDYSLR